MTFTSNERISQQNNKLINKVMRYRSRCKCSRRKFAPNEATQRKAYSVEENDYNNNNNINEAEKLVQNAPRTCITFKICIQLMSYSCSSYRCTSHSCCMQLFHATHISPRCARYTFIRIFVGIFKRKKNCIESTNLAS